MGYALRSFTQSITIPSYFKKGVDAEGQNEDTNFRCETRRYLSWIEGLTTNQYVGGSNPSRRTIELQKLANRRAFLLPYAPSGLYAGSHSFSVSFGCAFPRGEPYKWDGFPARPLSLFALRRVAHLVFWDPKNCPIGDLPRLSSRQCFVDRGPKIDEDVRKGVLLRALSCFLSLRYKCTAFFLASSVLFRRKVAF